VSDREVDVSQRPELLVDELPANEMEQVFLEGSGTLLGEAVAEGDPVEADGGVGGAHR
jgi:riboflavin biosynthesis pyrimidine reductase